MADEADARRGLARRRWPGPGGRAADHGRGAVPDAVAVRRRRGGPAGARGCRSRWSGSADCSSTPEVVDVVSTLHVIADPDRGDALMRLLTGPMWRLGAARPRGAGPVGAGARAAQRGTRRRSPADGTPGRASRPSADVVDEASIVEALDALPRAGLDTTRAGSRLSAAGRERLARLGDELRGLRSRGVAAAARARGRGRARARCWTSRWPPGPGHGPAGARAHLDALAEVAAGFAASAELPTLAAFLSWLEAAEVRERGLAPGQTDATEVEVLPVDARPSESR